MVETMKRLEELRERRERLALREKELDEQQRRMQQCLRNITDDTINEQYPLNSRSRSIDICRAIAEFGTNYSFLNFA